MAQQQSTGSPVLIRNGPPPPVNEPSQPQATYSVHCQRGGPLSAEDQKLCADFGLQSGLDDHACRVGLSKGTLTAEEQKICAEKYHVVLPVEKWRRVEADNGAVFAIDMNSISRWSTGGVYAITCVADKDEAGNDVCPLLGKSRVVSDCHGHYNDWDHHISGLAPPRSVVGQMAAIACATAQ